MTRAGGFDAAHRVLAAAVASRVMPGAAVEVGTSTGPLWRTTLGTLSFDADSPAVREDTPYDLASLTKPVATATIVVHLASRDRLRLEAPVREHFDEWRGADRAPATIRDLLEHASGLPARLLDRPPEGRRAFEHEICGMPLEHVPRAASVYSDLGFILLGFLAADAGARPLDAQFEDARQAVARIEPAIAATPFGFAPATGRLSHAAPTEPLPDDQRRGRRLAGEVHDDYGAALGGVAGHTGLFGTASAVGAFARAVLRAARGDEEVPPPLSPALVRLATTRSTVPGSSRALGWDTMRPSSSCGSQMTPSAFGHVGFTGTSLWIDPPRDRYFVLLTNRVCGGGTSEALQQVRRAFHDALG
jgi:serine-type D-Ala-D-Ala carboxypeptidase